MAHTIVSRHVFYQGNNTCQLLQRTYNSHLWQNLQIRYDPRKYFHSQTHLLKEQVTNTKGRKRTSQDWLYRQLNDKYVKMSRLENYRCRSAYKLVEMDERFGLLKSGDVVVDCGAAPGSWCQVAVQRVNAKHHDKKKPQGIVIGVDLQSMMPVEGATLLSQSDFTLFSTQHKILKQLNKRRATAVLSDLAPSPSGIKSMDHELIIGLCESALKFSVVVLEIGGLFVCKLWQGSLQKQFETRLKSCFKTVNVVKPNASRAESAEIFYVAQHFTGIPTNK